MHGRSFREARLNTPLSRNRAQAAFTLVELLVVIAIISVLAGLLLPALQNAMDSARRVACLNNLKQLALGWESYAGGYGGFYPQGERKDVGGNIAETGSDFAPSGGDELFYRFGNNQCKVELDLTEEVFWCPADATWNVSRGLQAGSGWADATDPGAPCGYSMFAGRYYLKSGQTNPLYNGPRRSGEDNYARALLSDILYLYATSSANRRFFTHPSSGSEGVREGSLLAMGSSGVPDGGNAVFTDGHGAWVRHANGVPYSASWGTGWLRLYTAGNWKSPFVPLSSQERDGGDGSGGNPSPYMHYWSVSF